jgi:hypothetical protein
MSDLEKLALETGLGLLGFLLGLLWRMLNEKIKSNSVTQAQAIRLSQQMLLDKITAADTSTATRFNEMSGRLNAGSARMDKLNDNAASLRVKLAEEYHSAAEVRTLITDLIAPQRDQLADIKESIESLRNEIRRSKT